MKKNIFRILLGLALFLLPFTAVKAASTKAGDNIYVSKDEIVNGNLYAAGQSITIDGNISGDLIAAAQTINVNGRIEGDIIAASQSITINGEVGGNVRVAGNSLSINGTVARNVNAFGADVIFGANSRIGWDAYVAGANLESRGTIDGSLSGWAGKALITGNIGKDLNLKLANSNVVLTIEPGAVVNGNVTYTAKNPAQISNKAEIHGQVNQQIPQTKNVNWFLLWLWKELFSIFAAIVVGLVLIFIGKSITYKILDKIEEKPTKMILPGLILMFILPPIAIVLMFTVIGIPLALIVGTWWAVGIYLAKIFTAIIVGKLILSKIRNTEKTNLLIPLILGVVICWLLFAIPFIGWIIGLIAIWLGLGGIWTYASHQLRNI